jgi:hypothetical protein
MIVILETHYAGFFKQVERKNRVSTFYALLPLHEDNNFAVNFPQVFSRAFPYLAFGWYTLVRLMNRVTVRFVDKMSPFYFFLPLAMNKYD